ncbi:C2H2-type domain-containing protein [Mycena kentingensis (nom. inval.)]|nr:C2H2-type domain-containing protein [Mycena kentingensis (nom. inval.)]
MLDSLPALCPAPAVLPPTPRTSTNNVPRAFLNLPSTVDDDPHQEPVGPFHYQLAPQPASAPHDRDAFYLPRISTHPTRRISDPPQYSDHYTYANPSPYDDQSPHTPDSPYLPGALRQVASDWKQEDLSPPFFGSPQYAVRPDENTYGPSPPGTATSSSSTHATLPSTQLASSLPSASSQQQPQTQQQAGAASGDSDASRKTYSFVALPGNTVRKRPRRRYDEIERLYHCSWPDCNKAYGTLNHLNAHVQMQKHGAKRSPNEFKELRKQWRKAKKEMESPSHHPHAPFGHGLGFGGGGHGLPQLPSSAGPIRRSMSTVSLRRDEVYAQYPYSSQQHQRSYSHGSTALSPPLGVTIPGPRQTQHHDSYGGYGSVQESQSPQSAYSLTSSSDYRGVGVGIGGGSTSTSAGMPSSWPPMYSSSPHTHSPPMSAPAHATTYGTSSSSSGYPALPSPSSTSAGDHGYLPAFAFASLPSAQFQYRRTACEQHALDAAEW